MQALLAQLMHALERWTGITLSRGGQVDSFAHLVDGRVAALGLESTDTYCQLLLDDPEHVEVKALINVVTVGHTWFHRDAGQMAAIRELIWGRAAEETIQIWVPGCSTGEDAYTLAMLGGLSGRDVRVTASDINTEAIRIAQVAQYGRWSIRELPRSMRVFLNEDLSKQRWSVLSEITAQVTFQHHNLLREPLRPPSGAGWDLILCRNVMIYFSAEVVSQTLGRLSKALSHRGFLLLGASEFAVRPPAGLEVTRLGRRHALQLRRRAKDDAVPRSVKSSEAGKFAGTGAEVVAEKVRNTPARPGSLVTGDERQTPRHITPSTGHLTAERYDTDTHEAPERAPGTTGRSSRIEDTERPGHSASELATQLIKGGLMLREGRTAEAALVFVEASDVAPLSAEARLYAGIAYHMCGDPQAAAEILRAALFLDRRLWPASFYLAISYDKLARNQEALREYRSVVEFHDEPLILSAGEVVLGDLNEWRQEIVATARRRVRRGLRNP